MRRTHRGVARVNYSQGDARLDIADLMWTLWTFTIEVKGLERTCGLLL